MKIGIISAVCCGLLGSLFLIMGIIFAVLKEKGAILISGFNTLPKSERKRYDCEKMSRDQRNTFFLWSVVLFVGAVLSLFCWSGSGIIAFIIWLILILKDVHLDVEKAFRKYKKY